jgi:hypothetical protein
MNTLYTYFLGPKGENMELFQKLINLAIEWNKKWRENFFEDESIYPTGFFETETFKEESRKLEETFSDF